MLLLAAVLFVSIPMAQAAENTLGCSYQSKPARISFVQPRAKEFAPPNHPDVGSGAAHDIDMLYRELTDRRSRTPVSNPGKQ
jgi:hypothetical protein